EGEGLVGFLERVGRLHPGLGRNAPDAEARAAELRLLLDADRLGAELRGADRGGVPARAAAEDSYVTFHGFGSSLGVGGMLARGGRFGALESRPASYTVNAASCFGRGRGSGVNRNRENAGGPPPGQRLL